MAGPAVTTQHPAHGPDMQGPRRARPDFAPIDLAAVALGAVLLGHALQLNNGFYSPAALLWLSLALGAVLAGVLGLPRRLSGRRGSASVVAGVLVAGLLSNVVALATSPPAMYLADPAPEAHPGFLAGVCALLVCVVMLAWRPQAARRVWFPALLVTYAALAVWVLKASPRPHVDVVTVHNYAVTALTHGDSPYGITFPNIYGHDGAYPPGMARNGRVLFGFPYPPLSLLMSAPARLLARDVRYALVVSMLAGAGLAGYLPRRRAAPLAAALLLSTPRGLFVLEQAWTEPLAVAWLGAAVTLGVRGRRGEALALGGLMAVKQHLAVVAPLLAWYRRGRPDAWRFALTALGVAAAVTLPFVLWDPAGFWKSVVYVQAIEPLRRDALSYLAWMAAQGTELSATVQSLAPIAAVAIGLALTWLCLPRSPAGLSIGLALILFLVFAVGKKAFCNYYFLVLAGLAFGVAAADEDGAPPAAITPP